MAVTWYTEEEASDPKLIYSTDPSLTDYISLVPTNSSISDTYIYSTILGNLDYNQTYYYKVSSDSSNEREILNFTTIPSRNANKLKLLVYGDSRTQRVPRLELVIKAMENFNDVDFIMHTGDIVEDGRIQSQWNEYFDDIEILSRQIPGLYIEGNHERTDGKMYDNIPLPSNGDNSTYYSFNIGPLNLIGLNTERDYTIQTPWLEGELNKSSEDNNTLWKIAYMHQPIFSSMQ